VRRTGTHREFINGRGLKGAVVEGEARRIAAIEEKERGRDMGGELDGVLA
jgi:hypothetical protein